MKLRIKETGEIVELVGEIKRSYGKPDFTLDSYETLDELCKSVEDYEEPKEYWYISEQSAITKMANNPKDIPNFVEGCSSIGNLFKTKEEAEKAVEKLKAWTRLKEKGFKFDEWCWNTSSISGRDIIVIKANIKNFHADYDDNKLYLNLLFGGEE